MSDPFSNELNHLISVARSRISHLDSSIDHCNALSDRYQQLGEALERMDSSRDSLRAIVIDVLQGAGPAERSDAMEYEQRRRVA